MGVGFAALDAPRDVLLYSCVVFLYSTYILSVLHMSHQGTPSLRCGASCTFILSLQRHGRKKSHVRELPFAKYNKHYFWTVRPHPTLSLTPSRRPIAHAQPWLAIRWRYEQPAERLPGGEVIARLRDEVHEVLQGSVYYVS